MSNLILIHAGTTQRGLRHSFMQRVSPIYQWPKNQYGTQKNEIVYLKKSNFKGELNPAMIISQ